MKYSEYYNEVIAIKERAAGNETVGTIWMETKSFHRNTPICDIVGWAKDAEGKLIITLNEK